MGLDGSLGSGPSCLLVLDLPSDFAPSEQVLQEWLEPALGTAGWARNR